MSGDPNHAPRIDSVLQIRHCKELQKSIRSFRHAPSYRSQSLRRRLFVANPFAITEALFPFVLAARPAAAHRGYFALIESLIDEASDHDASSAISHRLRPNDIRPNDTNRETVLLA